jgi:deoxyribonuclease V
MILALDVGYLPDRTLAAAVGFADWTDARPAMTKVITIDQVQPYTPGSFYLRELPCLVQLIDQVEPRPAVFIVDGYVTLDADGRPGLGHHLFTRYGGAIPVIGVAKKEFSGQTAAIAITRGGSRQPLHITAAGVDPGRAAGWIAAMHGPHRIPTLLKRVDQLSRGLG